MPDRYGDDDPTPATTADPWAEPDPDMTAAMRAQLTSIAAKACTLCDADGYTPSLTVCDHTDHRPAAARGIANIRAQMGWTTPENSLLDSGKEPE